MRLTIIQYLVFFSCLCIFPASVYAADPCFNSCNVTVQGINSTYKPGEMISGTVNYSISNNSQCPSCVQQILVGITNVNGQSYDVTCVYNGSPKACPEETMGAASFSLIVPYSHGTYQILVSNYQQYSCANAKQNFPSNTAADRIVATIQVSGSATAISDTKISPPMLLDTAGSWIQQNLFWIVLLALMITGIVLMIWRSKTNDGSGLSLRTEINIITFVTIGLIVTATFIFFQQQIITWLIEISVVVLIYFLFRYVRIPGGLPGGSPEIVIDDTQLPESKHINGAAYKLGEVYSRKDYASKRVRELKRSGYFACVVTKKAKQKYSSGRIRYGYTYAVYFRSK